jgi:hypothetical protein
MVFDRYDIVTPSDLQDVARKLKGTFSGTTDKDDLDDQRVSSYYTAAGGVGLLVWPLDFKSSAPG